MRKKLFESKADIESGIAKSLSGARLDYSELIELESLSFSDLVKDHEVDSTTAKKILSHVGIERQRVEFQDQQTRDEDFKSLKKFNRRAYPFRESLKRRIRKIIKENLN